MRKAAVVATFIASALTVSAPLAAGTTVRIPLTCTRGPSGQEHVVGVSAPVSVAAGATYTVRIDGVPSGKISHTGLNYIFDMSSDYALPSGTTYVPGSAHIVPRTGTPNVAGSARVGYEGGMVRIVMPGHVESGSSYTPPSIEFQLKATAAAGATLGLAFSQYRVKANAFLVGDVNTTCDPRPKPYVIANTKVTAPDAL